MRTSTHSLGHAGGISSRSHARNADPHTWARITHPYTTLTRTRQTTHSHTHAHYALRMHTSTCTHVLGAARRRTHLCRHVHTCAHTHTRPRMHQAHARTLARAHTRLHARSRARLLVSHTRARSYSRALVHAHFLTHFHPTHHPTPNTHHMTKTLLCACFRVWGPCSGSVDIAQCLARVPQCVVGCSIGWVGCWASPVSLIID